MNETLYRQDVPLSPETDIRRGPVSTKTFYFTHEYKYNFKNLEANCIIYITSF